MPKFQPEDISFNDGYDGDYNFGDSMMWVPKVTSLPVPTTSGECYFVSNSGFLVVYDSVINGWMTFALSGIS